MSTSSRGLQLQGGSNNEHTPPHIESDFKQQRMPACRPFLTPCFASIVFAVFTVCSVVFCVFYHTASEGVEEVYFRYDDLCNGSSTCVVSFNIERKLEAPVFIYYQLTNVYHSNFMFASSRDWKQLQGEAFKSVGDLSKCKPVVGSVSDPKLEQVFVPCGASARSVFNDNFVFNGLPAVESNGISPTNYKKLFKQPHSSYASAIHWLEPDFPGGQTNERFINWMKEASFPKFRKLWGKITEAGVEPGHYTVEIQNRFPVDAFGGRKALILSESSWAGGKARFLYIFFMAMAAVSFVTSLILFIMQYYNMFPLYKSLALEGASLDIMLLL